MRTVRAGSAGVWNAYRSQRSSRWSPRGGPRLRPVNWCDISASPLSEPTVRFLPTTLRRSVIPGAQISKRHSDVGVPTATRTDGGKRGGAAAAAGRARRPQARSRGAALSGAGSGESLLLVVGVRQLEVALGELFHVD